MKKTLGALLMMGTVGVGSAAGLCLSPSAHAAPSWVADESAGICNALYLESQGYDWNNTQIQLLQLSYDVSRAQAVQGIRQAATEYCPEYLSAAPSK